jgi:Methyltransferase domain
MIKLADTKDKYTNDGPAKQQLADLFGDTTKYTLEFDPFWNEMLPQAIKMHNRHGMGEYAGSGCVDYNEAKALYIFTRLLRPKIVVELGYAGGISTSFIARGLEMNGAGQVHTVDLSPEYWDVCPTFQQYRKQETIVQYHATDAIQFLKDTDVAPILTFSDATHEEEPTRQIAELLKKKWPHAVHLYHEWGMSNKSAAEERSYVSMQNLIGTQYERDAFENVFGEQYRHGGLYGSCGLGIVMPL